MLIHLKSPSRRLKLDKQFTILLFLVFAVGIVVSGVALSTILNRNAQNEITSKALMLIGTMNSVRDYTNTQVKPELADKLQSRFLPQTVPAYSAREIFEKLRADNTYRDFSYKEATINPTNLRDRADSFEREIVERFRRQTDLQELRGFRSSPSGELFYIARPLAISKSSCLECHSTPQAAPKSMIQLYGTAHGFGWKLNDIVGTQMISVPATKVLQQAHKLFVLLMGVIVVVFAVTMIMVNTWLKRYIARPLNRMAAQVAEAVNFINQSTPDL